MRSLLPFGIAEVDSRLPGGGLTLGALHEIAGGGNGAVNGARDIYIPDLHIDTIKVKARNFHRTVFAASS